MNLDKRYNFPRYKSTPRPTSSSDCMDNDLVLVRSNSAVLRLKRFFARLLRYFKECIPLRSSN